MSHCDPRMNTRRFGPSPLMMVGGLLTHPLFYLGLTWVLFAFSSYFREVLWAIEFGPWRRLLYSFWVFTKGHSVLPVLLLLLPAAHMVVRYTTTFYTMGDDFLFVQSGMMTGGSPGGWLRIYSDSIPASTISDANVKRGILGLLSGTGTIYVMSSETSGGAARLTWVPNVLAARDAILARAGVRNARMLSQA